MSIATGQLYAYALTAWVGRFNYLIIIHYIIIVGGAKVSLEAKPPCTFRGICAARVVWENASPENFAKLGVLRLILG